MGQSVDGTANAASAALQWQSTRPPVFQSSGTRSSHFQHGQRASHNAAPAVLVQTASCCPLSCCWYLGFSSHFSWIGIYCCCHLPLVCLLYCPPTWQLPAANHWTHTTKVSSCQQLLHNQIQIHDQIQIQITSSPAACKHGAAVQCSSAVHLTGSACDLSAGAAAALDPWEGLAARPQTDTLERGPTSSMTTPPSAGNHTLAEQTGLAHPPCRAAPHVTVQDMLKHRGCRCD
jgi:hypothetical protein